ncbi:protein kinase domain-containing protein [Corynebacterium heidelbergense]|uniref:non-specific serine/threonine protein kinase n=1 Tax=Corynebacterium heidelbergense TaxID=2055947 RepID=A0A364V5Z7_9CORY|nr:protein kinase [Corynebacterium heidelbergense]RAV32034.1 serine/threonine protein kinase [Corynebacterium heidelbergense]
MAEHAVKNLSPGSLLDDRYRLGRAIASGGMSTVYHAVDERLDREVAVKVMDPLLAADPTFRIRFEREARAVARLNHPSLVNVFDQGVDRSHDGELVFLVMELVPGGSLRELLKERGPMPPHAALAVMSDVLTALSVAHRTGMIHRDIKPDNVLISDEHQVKLADFGLVRAIATGVQNTGGLSRSGLTTAQRELEDGSGGSGAAEPGGSRPRETTQVIGTAAYLSPEQVRGEELNHASDVYSAGILLFELITGQTPFHGETDELTAVARLRDSVPAPSELIDGVPPAIDELVATACALRPDDRFADGGEFRRGVVRTIREENLPGFIVPAPVNSAVHRALEQADFGERLSWDDESMATRAVLLRTQQVGADHTSEQAAFDRPESVAGQGLGPDDAYGQQGNDRLGYSSQPRYSPASPDPSQHYDGAVGEPPMPHAAAPAQHPAPLAAHVAPASPEIDRAAQKPLSNRSAGGRVLWFLVITGLVAAVALGGWWLTSGRYGEVPNVLGMEPSRATRTIEQAGFHARTQQRYDNDTPASHILSVTPGGGEKTRRGGEVTIVVSQGRPTVPDTVPERNLEEMQTLLEQRSLRHTLGPSLYSSTLPEGKVALLDPPSGTKVDTDTVVTIRLSGGSANTASASSTGGQGSAATSLPRVIGQSGNRARSSLEALGLRVTVEGGSSGVVISQEPQAGARVQPGEHVTIRTL